MLRKKSTFIFIDNFEKCIAGGWLNQKINNNNNNSTNKNGTKKTTPCHDIQESINYSCDILSLAIYDLIFIKYRLCNALK